MITPTQHQWRIQQTIWGYKELTFGGTWCPFSFQHFYFYVYYSFLFPILLNSCFPNLFYYHSQFWKSPYQQRVLFINYKCTLYRPSSIFCYTCCESSHILHFYSLCLLRYSVFLYSFFWYLWIPYRLFIVYTTILLSSFTFVFLVSSRLFVILIVANILIKIYFKIEQIK